MRIFTFILIIIFLLLQYRLWFGKNSVQDYYSLKKDVERQIIANDKLKQQNRLLFADVDDLKLGIEAIEERARNELGMIKEGETFFRITPQQKKSTIKQKLIR